MPAYDVIIIGSGPGGYVCAIRCAQLGLKTACVEGRETLGGTCLNVGCIPSKALLHASHMLHEAEHNFAKMGLKGKSPSVDWSEMLAYKDGVIEQNTKGIEFLFKKNKVDWIKGWASIPEAGKVKVGDEVTLYAQLSKVGRTSMQVHVDVWARSRFGKTGAKVTEAEFIFVALDEDGSPRQIPAEPV